MGILDIAYTILIKPLQLIFEVLYMITLQMIGDPGLSIIVLSLMMNVLVLPLYMRADAMQEREREMEARLRKGVAHIRKTFTGDEKVMMLQTYYRQNNYRPTDVFKGSISLFLEIPFFISAYMFLSHLQLLHGVQLWIIPDLGEPDGLLKIGNLSINLLPFLMTGINVLSCSLFTKGMPAKTKIQLYGMAAFFLVFLYASPSGLVFYWTLNNLFALVKTIFYKLRNPKRVLVIGTALIGAVLLTFGLFAYDTPSAKKQLLVIGLGFALLAPLAFAVLRSKINWRPKLNKQPNRASFVASGIFMTTLVGITTPSAVIASSPQEFVFSGAWLHPLWYAADSFFLAMGMFLIWFGVFYWLCNDRAKVVFEALMWLACGIGFVNTMFFNPQSGSLLNTLKYSIDLTFSGKSILINAAVILIVTVVLCLLFFKANKAIPRVLLISAIALAGMGIYNSAGIISSVSQIAPLPEQKHEDSPQLTLSTEGKNVVVIMMDRAMGEYVPYLVNEKPELKELFSGFTYYPNTVSFGFNTNVASAALFGGYEYTPTELNARDGESLKEKQNEALQVLPVLFSKADYDVTVFDPPYAGYQWTPDLSIYDDYSNVKAYNTDGYFVDPKQSEEIVRNNKRNFFMYGVFRCLPSAMKTTFYNNGHYLRSDSSTSVIAQTAWDNNLGSDGISASFTAGYAALENLSDLTKFNDNPNGCFFMMSNNTTHEPMMLQEGDYTVALHVDNTEYETKNRDRYTVDGTTLTMETNQQYVHYQTNMAALLKLGEWLEYLRQNDCYDNTRIIIVSDHGRALFHNDQMLYDGTMLEEYDLESYYPLLMVKDFNSKEFSTNQDFMTNADTPTLATERLIESAVNPLTGKSLNNEEKYAHEQLVFYTPNWSIYENNGNTFAADGIWFSVSNDMRKTNNWHIVDVSPNYEPTTLPEEYQVLKH